jgi:hypothetical protein
LLIQGTEIVGDYTKGEPYRFVGVLDLELGITVSSEVSTGAFKAYFEEIGSVRMPFGSPYWSLVPNHTRILYHIDGKGVPISKARELLRGLPRCEAISLNLETEDEDEEFVKYYVDHPQLSTMQVTSRFIMVQKWIHKWDERFAFAKSLRAHLASVPFRSPRSRKLARVLETLPLLPCDVVRHSLMSFVDDTAAHMLGFSHSLEDWEDDFIKN